MVKKKPKRAIKNDHQAPAPALFLGDLAAQHITDICHVITDLTIESVCRYFGGNKYSPDKSTIRRIHQCIDEASKLVTPQATYHLFKVLQTIPGRKIILEGGSQLSVPDCFEVTDAQLVSVVIGTLGADLEEHCRYLASKNEIYQSSLMDAIGTAMLDLLSEHVCTVISDRCTQYDLVRGPRFAPGIDGYPLEQQRVLFELADNVSVGVSLNSSAIMVPTKSISFFQTLTKSSDKRSFKNKCSHCKMVRCQFRQILEKTDH
ncbi:MAG: hypothetical protein HKP41_17510 [Desulfobacterales bacterium]|nr:hypothetical protein [Deltaproteobacteria bacterium]NNK96152.1 hypothetical protein [Desulfobacterales bacterium]